MMDAQIKAKPWQHNERELRKLPLEVSIPRRVECVDALKGIKEPATAIQAARAALKALVEKIDYTHWNESEVETVRRALAMLEGLD